MDRHWMDCLTGLGGEKRRSSDGQVTAARDWHVFPHALVTDSLHGNLSDRLHAAERSTAAGS
jgi:hypothetical protein